MSSADDGSAFRDERTKNSLKASAPSTEQVLEQYKLYVEMADRISARRQTANSFFLTVNTAIVALLGYLRTVQENSGVGQLFFLVAAAGMVLAYLWYRTVRSYQNLNSAKFEVIHEIEQALPLRPYDREWEKVGRGKNPKLYLPVTDVELRVPWVFLALHSVALTLLFPWQGLRSLLCGGG